MARLLDADEYRFAQMLAKSASVSVRDLGDAVLAVAVPDLEKVGPKGYEHGWIFVGAPGVGAVVHHPEHGRGVVSRAGKATTGVTFDSGHHAAFEHRSGVGAPGEHFVERKALRAPSKKAPKAGPPAVKPAEVASAQPAAPTSPQVVLHQRGKKGDLAIMESRTSSHGQRGGRSEGKQYELVRVGGTDRDGTPTSYHSLHYGDPKPGDKPIKLTRNNKYDHTFHIVPADRIDAPAAIAAARANPWHPDKPVDERNSGKPFESMDEIKAVLAPHVKTPPPPKPVKHMQRPLVPSKPRRIPQTPGGYKEPTALEPGAKVTWRHHHADGSDTTRTGRVWSGAPHGAAWVIPDEKLPTDQYHAIAVHNDGRGGRLSLRSSDSDELTAHAARAANEHKHGPRPDPFTVADLERHMREASEATGTHSGIYHESGMTFSHDSTLKDILQGFGPYRPEDKRMTPEQAVSRLRQDARLMRDNMTNASATDQYAHYDRRWHDWKSRSALYDELANRLESDWQKRGTAARGKGSVKKSAAAFDQILRIAERAWLASMP